MATYVLLLPLETPRLQLEIFVREGFEGACTGIVGDVPEGVDLMLGVTVVFGGEVVKGLFMGFNFDIEQTFTCLEVFDLILFRIQGPLVEYHHPLAAARQLQTWPLPLFQHLAQRLFAGEN